MSTQTATRQPAVFVAHGGGPLPLLGHPPHSGLTRWLEGFSKDLPAQPKAVLVISAHWEVGLFLKGTTATDAFTASIFSED